MSGTAALVCVQGHGVARVPAVARSDRKPPGPARMPRSKREPAAALSSSRRQRREESPTHEGEMVIPGARQPMSPYYEVSFRLRGGTRWVRHHASGLLGQRAL